MNALEKKVKEYGIKIRVTELGLKVPGGGMGNHPMYAYKVKLTFGKKQLTTPFYQGTGHTKSPTAADVLASLIADESIDSNCSSFASFCDEFGYDPHDDRNVKVHKATYKSIKAMGVKVRAFLRPHLDEFAEAARDY